MNPKASVDAEFVPGLRGSDVDLRYSNINQNSCVFKNAQFYLTAFLLQEEHTGHRCDLRAHKVAKPNKFERRFW
jgi:hypothetical protein